MKDHINPEHYKSHPSGVEAIEIIEWLPANLANSWKYLHRLGLKDTKKQEIKKALWYIQREIKRRQGLSRGRVALDFYEPKKLSALVKKFLRHESGARRQVFHFLWDAITHPLETGSLQNVELLIKNRMEEL